MINNLYSIKIKIKIKNQIKMILFIKVILVIKRKNYWEIEIKLMKNHIDEDSVKGNVFVEWDKFEVLGSDWV